MATTSAQQQARGVPDGYVAIPISIGQKASPVRISVVARVVPDPVGGTLVTLRQTADARVYLGTLIDVGGRVHAWLELWVQSLDALADTLAAWREALTNAVLDQRWQRTAERVWANDAAAVVRTGWETRHPVPVWVDVVRGEPVTAADPTGEAWKLCRDDAVLAAAGLPPYAGSLHRYLYLPKKGVDAGFVPVTPGAPANQNTRPADLPLGGRTDLVAFNPGGGLLLVRELAGLSLEDYLGLLAGAAAAQPVFHGRTPVHLFGPGPAAAAAGRTGGVKPPPVPEGWWLLGPGRGGNGLLEGLYLRLRLWVDVAEAVRARAGDTRAPLLNVEPGRFQVRIGEARPGLPAFWTARAVLVDPGDTVEVPTGSGGPACYLPARPLPASTYRRAPVGQAAESACAVRIDGVTDDEAGGLVVDGAIISPERVDAGPKDVIRLWLPLGPSRVRVHANLDARDGTTTREWRFRSFPQQFDPDTVGRLRAATGVAVAGSAYEVLPALGAAWDLYSVGVIGARALLVNASNDVASAVGELANLASRAAADLKADDPLPARVRRAVEAEPRLAAALGSHRLAWDGAAAGRATRAVPPELWWDVLATLVEALYGDGVCGTPGSGAGDELGAVFAPFLAKLNRLLIRTRCLFVPDWEGNLEMDAVIQRALGGGGPASP
jgi:hypothetical protein